MTELAMILFYVGLMIGAGAIVSFFFIFGITALIDTASRGDER